MPLIYIVDDEPHIRHLAAVGLKDAGFETAEFSDGAVLLHAVNQKQPDAILLDWMMPGQDGLSVLKTLRQNAATRPIPILMMTARSDEVDRVLGLELGADDYVTKPFSPSELMARVDALYRRVLALRSREEVSYLEEITSGDFVLNLRSRTLLKHGQPIELTQVEFQIMEYFFTNPGKALSRTSILTRVWGEEYFGEEKIVDVNIRRLRMKIEEDPSSPQYILTVWGMGYKWSVPD